MNNIRYLKVSDKAKIPTKGTRQATGYDLYSAEDVVIEPGGRAAVSTGLVFNLDGLLPSVEMQIRPRSGLAIKHGVTVLNAPGTIDRDYRGEVRIILINHGSESYSVAAGDKIAQMVLAVYIHDISMFPVSEVSEDTDRGAGGFNSTGYR